MQDENLKFYPKQMKDISRLDESMAMSRDLRAKEISPPSYMKRYEREPNEQLLRHIWLNILHPRMLRRHDLSQPLFYLPLWKER